MYRRSSLRLISRKKKKTKFHLWRRLLRYSRFLNPHNREVAPVYEASSALQPLTKNEIYIIEEAIWKQVAFVVFEIVEE
jgi:hypothetical protein